MAKKSLNTKLEVLFFINQAQGKYPEWQTFDITLLPEPIYPEGLKNVDLSRAAMANIRMDNITKSVLCGTITCDTSFTIPKNYANARYQMKHSTRQCEWFMWKNRVVLRRYSADTSIVWSPPDGFQPSTAPGEVYYGKLKLASYAHQDLTQLHDIICVKGRKTIQRFWLNHMNNYFLMTVWLDDGSLYNGRQGRISINQVPEHEQNVFMEYLRVVWGIKCHSSLQTDSPVQANGAANRVIDINTRDDLFKLLRLVAPVIPVREMLYKVCYFDRNNVDVTQRWRSELLALVRPEFVNSVREYYTNLRIPGLLNSD